MAAELELPRHVFVHGYLLSPRWTTRTRARTRTRAGELEKMSKSLGNVHRPVQGRSTLRPRRAAPLLLPRGDVRAGRSRVRVGLRRALRDGARQRVRQPRGADARDDPALPRRVVPDAAPEDVARDRLRGPGRPGRRAARPGRPVRGARRDLAARTAPEPLRRGARAVGARQRRGERGRARRGARRAGRGRARADGPAAPVHARDRGASARRAGEPRRLLRRRAVRRRRRRCERRRPRAALPKDPAPVS